MRPTGSADHSEALCALEAVEVPRIIKPPTADAINNRDVPAMSSLWVASEENLRYDPVTEKFTSRVTVLFAILSVTLISSR